MDSNPQYLDMKKILSCIERSVRNGNPFSVVRVGHADMFAIKKFLWGEDISDFDRYRHYSGITDVDECAVRGSIRAVRNADVVGTTHHSARWNLS